MMIVGSVMGSEEGCQHALFCSTRSAGHSHGVGTFLEDGQTSVSAIEADLELSYIGAAQNLQNPDNSEG